MGEVVRLHASSGTTGKPIVVAYTQADVQVWANVVMRALAGYGLHAGDVIQNAYGYGLFTGGLGLHYGAEALGATVLPISGGNTERQIMADEGFRRLGHLAARPAISSTFSTARKRWASICASCRSGSAVSAPSRGPTPCGSRIETAAGIKAFDIYGLTEIIGPGVGAECREQNGLHIFEDHFYPEIIDPETLAPLPDGCEGELVLTTLSKQAMPMIRYRTRDITSLVAEPCPCGRTIRRIRRISRRSDDMMIVRGVNVFPSQIETAILAVESTLPHYEIWLTRHKDLDQIEVRVEVTREVFSDRVGSLENLQGRLAAADRAGDRAAGRRAAGRAASLERSPGKARRVVDRREG